MKQKLAAIFLQQNINQNIKINRILTFGKHYRKFINTIKISQWRNTCTVIDWFKSLTQKRQVIFVEIYPSIIEELFHCSILLAKSITSRPEVFLRKGVLKICSKFTGDQPCRSVICNFLEITLRRGCSPVDLLHIFRTPFLKNSSGRLPLKVYN